MKTIPKIMPEAVKYFRQHGFINPCIIMRKFKLDFEFGELICQQIEKRFPNLWRDGREKFIKKMKV